MKVGDLVCYNGAGQRNKSLGIITDVFRNTANGSIRGYDTYYNIVWTKVPEYLPRGEWEDPRLWRADTYPTATNRTSWYKQGGWFEKVKVEPRLSNKVKKK